MWVQHVLVIYTLFVWESYSQDFTTFTTQEMTTTTMLFEIPTTTQITTTEEIATTEELATTKEITTTEAMIVEAEKKMSEQIMEILERLKNPELEGIPGVEIPDPLPIPDIKYPVTFFDVLYLENATVHGISKLRILHVDVDFEDMKVDAAMSIASLQVLGNYRYSSLLMPRRGPFTINISSLLITPVEATLGVQIDGRVQAEDINIDLTYENMEVNFENLGALGFMNSISGILVSLIKPSVLQEAHTKAKIAINQKLEESAGDIEFPNSIAPLDMVLVDARRKVREMRMDPYRAADYNSTLTDSMSFISLALTQTWITGLSSFHRIGDIDLHLENNTVVLNFEIGTQKLQGTTHWEISAGGLMALFGTASFSVEYISLRIVIAQSLDTRKRPVLQFIHLDVGNIQARYDGAGTIDYVIEFVINILPNVLRYQMVAAIEGPLKTKLQQELNGVDVEEEIKQALPRIDEIAESGFKLSHLRANKEEVFDVDDFFNF